MTDIRLVYDSVGRRWEGLIQPVGQWSSLDQYNEVLTIAYGTSGMVAGFVLDLDLASPEIAAALERVRELFGDVVATGSRLLRVALCPTSSCRCRRQR